MKPEEKFFNKISDYFLAQREDYGEIYVIGGYIRDKILSKFNKDLDFVVKKNSIKAAREIADCFGGDFYLLDRKRETARALIPLENQQLIVDVALINGENIFEDLKKRDFSINAMAINLCEPDTTIDPLGGQLDLNLKKLVPCSVNSFSDDPVRTLRAVRFIQNLGLNFDPNIKPAIISASKNLRLISAERIRDELCQILGLSGLDRSYTFLEEFEILTQVFPEIIKMKEIAPKFPHVHDGLTHSLRAAEYIRYFLDLIFNSNKKCENKYFNDVQSLIGKYKDSLNKLVNNFDKLNFSVYPLMAIVGLFHDSAKSNIPTVEDEGKIVFPDHAKKSAEITKSRMKSLAFSNEDINFVDTIIGFHMSPNLKSIGIDEKPNRAIYRYFQETGEFGVLLGFFHLADIIATYEETLASSRWEIAIHTVEKILDGWFYHFNDVIFPTRLLNGDELIDGLGMQPGRKVGLILESIREEQAAGTLFEKKMALEYAKKMIDEMEIND